MYHVEVLDDLLPGMVEFEDLVESKFLEKFRKFEKSKKFFLWIFECFDMGNDLFLVDYLHVGQHHEGEVDRSASQEVLGVLVLGDVQALDSPEAAFGGEVV